MGGWKKSGSSSGAGLSTPISIPDSSLSFLNTQTREKPIQCLGLTTSSFFLHINIVKWSIPVKIQKELPSVAGLIFVRESRL